MIRGWTFLGVAGSAALALLVTNLLACNGLLGIGAASLEEDAGGGGDAGSGEAATEFSCANYCSVIMQNCTGANAEYLSAAICNSMCPAFEQGTAIADTADDTLGCRLYFAEQAAQSPATSCRQAGPLGGNHCGSSPCGPFCDQDLGYCTGDKPNAYASVSGCVTACANYTYNTADAGDTTTESGNTLNCRLWHLETAYTSDAFGKFHCPHTAQVSTTCF